MATLQKLINQSNDAPPDISDTNYLDTDQTIGMVAATNEQIDKNIKDYGEHVQHKIDIFNSAFKKDMKTVEKVINFLPEGKKIFDNLKAIRDDENLVKSALDLYDKKTVEDDLDIVAEDIDNEINTGLQSEAGDLQANDGPKFAKNFALLSTLNSEGLNTKNSLDRMGLLIPSFYSQMKLHLKLPDGRGYGDLVTPDDIALFERHAAGIIFGTIREKHPEVTIRELGKHLVPQYKEARKSFFSQFANNQDTIATNAYNTGQKMIRWESTGNKDTMIQASFGPNGFIKQRSAYFEQLVPGKGMQLARKEWVADMKEGAKDGYVYNIDHLLTSEVQWNDGSTASFEKKFPAEALEIRTAHQQGLNQEFNELKELKDAKEKQWLFKEVYSYEGVRDREWIQNLHKKYRNDFKTTKLPEELKSLWTDSLELDQDKLFRLQHISKNGGVITAQDVATIENPTIKKLADELVNQETVGGVPTEINKSSEGFIKTYITKYTFENDLNKSQTTKFKAIEMQANRAFRAKFLELRGQNQSNEMSQLGALEFVEKQIKDGKFNKLPEYKYNLSAAHDLSIATTSLVVDKELLFSPNALEGEEKHLDVSDVYVKSNYKKGQIPQYYRELSKLFPDLDPHDFMMTRLVSTGRIKEVEDKYKGVENKRDFTNKPTSSKVYRNALTTDNFDWISESIINPAYASNGGYDAITKDGRFVELEKPLSEHTIGEVLQLTRDYDSFGMYNITNYGLKQILMSPDLPFDLDDLFDADTQTALVLGRLKQKANMGHILNGQPYFKRIVNIPKEDQERFYAIVGELPPMNQLGNLLPGVAKALVEDTLQ